MTEIKPSVKRLGIITGKWVREYLGVATEFMDGVKEGMGDMEELQRKFTDAMDSTKAPTPPPQPVCRCPFVINQGHRADCEWFIAQNPVDDEFEKTQA